MSNEKSLIITWTGLTKDFQIVFTLAVLGLRDDDDNNERYVVWKTLDVNGPDGTATITYSGRVGFALGRLGFDGDMETFNHVEVPLGQSVILTNPGGMLPLWGPPSASALPQSTGAQNATDESQAVSVGIFEQDEQSGETIYYPFFWAGDLENDITFDGAPTLTAYIEQGYEQGEIISDTPSDPIQGLSDLDLDGMAETTTFEIVQTPEGDYRFTQVYDSKDDKITIPFMPDIEDDNDEKIAIPFMPGIQGDNGTKIAIPFLPSRVRYV